NSVHFLKNPVLGQAYWSEVCGREDRTHLFHHKTHGVRAFDRSTPMTIAQTSFYGGEGMGYVLDNRQLPITVPSPRKTLTSLARPLTTPSPRRTFLSAARTSPRAPSAASSEEVAARRFRDPSLLGDRLDTFHGRHRLPTPSRRLPAGA
ncbi:unnamed protein product, partial [Polarella glacialis]